MKELNFSDQVIILGRKFVVVLVDFVTGTKRVKLKSDDNMTIEGNEQDVCTLVDGMLNA